MASGNCAVVIGSSADVVKRDVVMMVVRNGIVVSLEGISPLLVTWVVEVMTVVAVPATVRVLGISGFGLGRAVGTSGSVSAVVMITVVISVVCVMGG